MFTVNIKKREINTNKTEVRAKFSKTTEFQS